MSWGAGYVTDVTYPPGLHRQQAPAMLTLACWLSGVDAALATADEPCVYLELGCGPGLHALTLAAANPGWQVLAVDFSPAHIALARSAAHAAGIANATFIEADLATLADSPLMRELPEADFASLHGVWSWVAPAVRQGIVRLLAARVRPGGLVHVGYNSLPGWSGAMGLQRLIRESGRRLATGSQKAAEEGRLFAQALADSGAPHLKLQPLVRALLPSMAASDLHYLAHEYLNEWWQPCFAMDLAAAMADAKLEFAGSAQLLENFPDLTFTPEQRQLRDRFDDPAMREFVKDLCLERQFRHDVFVRGGRRLTAGERDARLAALTLAARTPAAVLGEEAEFPAGRGTLNHTYFGAIMAALEAGPRRVADLPRQAGTGAGDRSATEIVGVLVGLDHAIVLPQPAAVPTPAAMHLARLVASGAMSPDYVRQSGLTRLGWVTAVPSARAGAGIALPLLDAIVLEGLRAGEPWEPQAWAGALTADAGERTKLVDVLDRELRPKIPVYRGLGLIGEELLPAD